MEESYDMRTNIVINDKLMEQAKKATGLPTKKAVVEEALRVLIRTKKQQEILKLRGKIRWHDDLDEMREGRFVGKPR